MAEAFRRPKRWDHPFDPARQELVRLERSVKLFPDNASLKEQLARHQQEADAYVDRLLQVAPWNSIMTAPTERETLRQILLSDTRLRRYGKGELVVRQGDYGNSAFVILTGAVRVVLQPGLPAKQLGQSGESRRGWLGMFWQWMTSPGGEQRDLSSVDDIYRQARRDEANIPIFLQDVPRVLDHNATVPLGPGELFGEISSLGRTPRTATVFAEADDIPDGGKTYGGTELLEIRWQGLRDLINADPAFKEHVYVLYRRNALHEHLRATPMLSRAGDTQAIREAISRGNFKPLFVGQLGWEAHSDMITASSVKPPEAVAQLRFETGDRKGDVVPLDNAQGLVLGRSAESSLQILGDMSLSRKHAQLTYQDGNWILRNLSRFGTVLEGKMIRGDQVMRSGMSFRLGKTEIAFEAKQVEAPEPETTGAKAYSIKILARAPERRGVPEVTAFLCQAKDAIPDAETRSTVEAHVKRLRPGAHVIVYVAPPGVEQVWQWSLPEGYDATAHASREIEVRRPGDVQVLIDTLIRTLVINEVAKETEFQSHGEFTWSRRSLSEAEAGIDWTARSEKEPVIAGEGTYPNGVLLIRAGFARRSKSYNFGQRTLDYMGRGQVYGFQELVHNWRTPASPIQLQHSLTALGYTDVLFVPTAAVEKHILPSIPDAELPTIAPPVADDAGQDDPFRSAGDVPDGLREFLVERRYVNGTNTMLIDLDRCTRCDDCVRACASTHQNNPRFLRHGPTYGHYMVANACMHCADPVCMIGCPTGAISRSVNGQVVINDPTCIGCATCAGNCPYDNIRMVEIRNARGNFILDADNKPHRRATKCDLCFDQAAGPACVRACPHDAMARVDLNSLAGLSKWLG